MEEVKDAEQVSTETQVEETKDVYEQELSDYKAKLEAKEKEADSLKVALRQERQDKKEAPEEKQPEVDLKAEIDRAKAEVKAEATAELRQFKMDSVRSTLNEELEKASPHEKERELIKLVLEKEISVSDTSREGLRRAIRMAKAALPERKDTSGEADYAATISNSQGKPSGQNSDGSENLSQLDATFKANWDAKLKTRR